MARRVDQVQDVIVSVRGGIFHAYRVRLDRDPALPFQVHIIQDLVGHFALRNGVREFEQAVGQRGFAVIDVGDDAEISYVTGAHTFLCFKNAREYIQKEF